MYCGVKNTGENLVISKEVANIAVPRRRRFFESKTNNIRVTADKAGFFFGRFLFEEVDVLADFQKGLASFVIYIQQIFVSTMPRRDKNLTADARIASASTPAARKSASYRRLERLTKQSLIDLIERRANAALSPDQFFAAATSAFVEWMHCEDRGLYGTDVRDDRLLGKLQSLRMLYKN